MILLVGDVVDDIGVRPLGRINPASDTEAEIRMTCGGSAANVAAWLGHLGAPARFVGRAGVDGVQRHAGALTAHGVDARIGADPHLPTATIVLTLDDAADRTMFVDRAANTTLTPDHLTDDVWDDVTWLHLTGYTYFDEATRPVALAAVAEARSRGIGVSVDPSSLGFLEAAGRDTALRWFADADLVFPNEDEQRFLVVDDDHAVETRGAAGARFRGHDHRGARGRRHRHDRSRRCLLRRLPQHLVERTRTPSSPRRRVSPLPPSASPCAAPAPIPTFVAVRGKISRFSCQTLRNWGTSRRFLRSTAGWRRRGSR